MPCKLKNLWGVFGEVGNYHYICHSKTGTNNFQYKSIKYYA